MTKSFDELVQQIKEIEIKLAKYEPNSIMGVHWSNRLAGLNRKLKNEK